MTESTDLAFSVISPEADVIEAQALVIGGVKGDNGPELTPSVLDADSADAIEASLEDLGVTGAEDSLQRLPGYGDEGPGLIVLTGLGSLPRTGPERLDALRLAAGSAVRQLIGLDSVALNLPAESLSEVAALAEGAAYGAFFDPGQRTDEEIRSRRPVSDVAIVSGIDRDAADE
ncbi:MAG: leucyl aminopeptidase, partial [Kocuria sp.]|nr:leucyl aminopeptidase [Kocuria sp.]